MDRNVKGIIFWTAALWLVAAAGCAIVFAICPNWIGGYAAGIILGAAILCTFSAYWPLLKLAHLFLKRAYLRLRARL